MSRGRLFVVEGADCTGKTTLAKAFAQRIDAQYYAFPGREPGTLGHHIYELHHGIHGNFPIVPESLQMLHVAAHLTVLHTRIFPWLDAGESVVLDRFYWSTYVYGSVYGVPRDFLSKLVSLERGYWGNYLDHAVLFWITRPEPLSKPYDELDDKKALSRKNWNRLNSTYENIFCKNVWDDLKRRRIDNIEGVDEMVSDMMIGLADALKVGV